MQREMYNSLQISGIASFPQAKPFNKLPSLTLFSLNVIYKNTSIFFLLSR